MGKNVSTVPRSRLPIMQKTPIQQAQDKTTTDNLSIPMSDYDGLFNRSNPTIIEKNNDYQPRLFDQSNPKLIV